MRALGIAHLGEKFLQVHRFRPRTRCGIFTPWRVIRNRAEQSGLRSRSLHNRIDQRRSGRFSIRPGDCHQFQCVRRPAKIICRSNCQCLARLAHLNPRRRSRPIRRRSIGAQHHPCPACHRVRRVQVAVRRCSMHGHKQCPRSHFPRVARHLLNQQIPCGHPGARFQPLQNHMEWFAGWVFLLSHSLFPFVLSEPSPCFLQLLRQFQPSAHSVLKSFS